MTTSGFLSRPSAEPPQRGQHHPPWGAATPLGPHRQAAVHTEAVNRTAGTEPRAGRSRGRAAAGAIALWLRHALADAARAWALAAGAPPDLCKPASRSGEDR